MKTLLQIKNKIESLKRRLSGSEVRENFGEREIHELDEFLNDFWDYPQSERLIIHTLKGNFLEWCYSYTG